MKKYLYLISTVIAFSLPLVTHAALLTGIQAYWKMDEDTGTTAADATGNGFTASSIPGWGTGIINFASVFTSATNATTALAFPSSGSVSLWVNPPNDPFNFIGPWSWNNGGAAYVGVEDALIPGTWTSVFNITGGGEQDISGGAVSFNTWTMLTMTWNLVSTTWTVNFYVNGVNKGSVTQSGTAGSVGNLNIGSFGGSVFTGSEDEMGVWNRALSQSEVTQLYNGGAALAYPFILPGNDFLFTISKSTLKVARGTLSIK